MDEKEVCVARHRKEKKELQAQIQQLKHSIPKGDKKKKKDVVAQIAVLESELDAKHEQELQVFGDQDLSTTNEDVISEAVTELSVGCESESLKSTGANPTPDESAVKKPTKAQRRKVKKVHKAQQREERIQEQDAVNEFSARNVEHDKLTRILRLRGLSLFEIPADGNCLFSAIEDQLKQHSIENNVTSLRSQTANYMRSHRDEFLPFLVQEATGELYNDDEFNDFCDRLEKTSEWGGQAEIRALSEVLQRPIEVIQADGPSVTVGDQFTSQPLRLVYHRHKYGLGEHYSSARLLAKADPRLD